MTSKDKDKKEMGDWILRMANDYQESAEDEWTPEMATIKYRAIAEVLYKLYDDFFPGERRIVKTALSGGVTQTL